MPPKISPATVQPASPRPARFQNLLRELDRDLSPELQRTLVSDQFSSGRSLSGLPLSGRSPSNLLPSGLDDIDALVGGGFPVGCLSEISGSISSGRTSLVLALLARATRNGAHVAWVDGAEAFDPASAEAAGVVLERVLWVRAQQPLAALRCTERILETEGFALVVLDLTRRLQARSSERSKRGDPARLDARVNARVDRRNKRAFIPEAAWLRLTRLTAGKQNTLILLSDERLAGSRAALALEMQPAIAHFTGTPALLESLETRALLTRHHQPSQSNQAHQPGTERAIKVKSKSASRAA